MADSAKLIGESRGLAVLQVGDKIPHEQQTSLRQLLELYSDHSERHIEQILHTRGLLGRAIEFSLILTQRLYCFTRLRKFMAGRSKTTFSSSVQSLPFRGFAPKASRLPAQFPQ